MKIGLIGFGYIGTVCAAGLEQVCENIIVFDNNVEKIKSIESKTVYFPEKRVAEIINNSSSISSVERIDDFPFSNIDCFLITINTDLDEKTQTLSVENVKQTLEVLNDHKYRGTVIIRSTLPVGPDYTSIFSNFSFKVEFVPEFLREGTSLDDFRDTEVLVIGSSHDLEVDQSFAMRLFGSFTKDVQITNVETAVYTKLLNNAFHAIKISFANEAHRVGGYAGGVDPSLALDILCRDKKLNISAAYLRPGGPFGGPCLIKDLRSLVTLDTTSGLFRHIETINSTHIEQLAISVIKILEKQQARTYNFDTYEFKPNSGDDRSSIAHFVANKVEKIAPLYTVSRNNPDAVFCGRSIMDKGLVKQI